MWWILVQLGVGPALAGSSDAAAQAEARRLSEEVERLMKKGHWKGVERTYARALETGAELDAETHLAGARSSMQIGDATAARTRLLAAYELDRNPETLQWLTTFSHQYTRVELRVDPGSQLQIERRHFDNERALVVDHAAEQLAKEHRFEGLLPMGRYRIGSFWFSIREDNPDIEADLRECAKAGTCTD